MHHAPDFASRARTLRRLVPLVSILLALGALVVLARLTRAAPPADRFYLTGALQLRDPLARAGLPANRYTVTARIADQVVASWTLTGGDGVRRPYALSVALGARGVVSGSRVTFAVHDAAGVRGRSVATATVGAGRQTQRDVLLDFRPNLLLLITDDQRHDQMHAMPLTQAAIFSAGVTFERAYVSSSLCCPSRINMLTGRYAHNSGVFLNQELAEGVATYAELLHAAGYRNGHIGKYTNAWSGQFQNAPRPEYDMWADHPVLAAPPAPYGTYVARDHALAFLRQTAAHPAQPFLLALNFQAPHIPVIPDPQDAQLFRDLPPLRPPSYNPTDADMRDKPAVYRALPRYDAATQARLDALRLGMLQTLVAVDRSVEALIGALHAGGLLTNTLIVFISDNGYHLGEHRLEGKSTAYEEAVRVPLAMRYDRLVRWPRAVSTLAANVDLLPTLLDAAGVPLPAGIDGVSLLPVLAADRPPTAPHRQLLPLLTSAQPAPIAPPFTPDPLTGRSYLVLHGLDARTDYVGIHSGRYVYVEHFGDRSELYDLAVDPYQLHNRDGDAAYRSVQQALAARLLAERQQWGPRVQLYGDSPQRLAGWGYVGTPQRWVAGVWPTTATLPLTYRWQIDGGAPITRVVYAYSDAISVTWPQRGIRALSVTVEGVDFGPLTRSTRVQIALRSRAPLPAD